MVFGFGLATVAGFLFTAVPNWTGRMPLQGAGLGWLVALWGLGRVAVFGSAWIGEAAAAPLDLAFPAALVAVMGREILAGRNWRNLPVLAALGGLLLADAWVHLGTLGVVPHPQGGDRTGLAVLLLLISMMGGRLIPSFTRNWLARAAPRLPDADAVRSGGSRGARRCRARPAGLGRGAGRGGKLLGRACRWLAAAGSPRALAGLAHLAGAAAARAACRLRLVGGWVPAARGRRAERMARARPMRCTG